MIRKLESRHIPWAQAIITHSNIFHSPVWSKVYPDGQVERAYKFYNAVERLCELNIESGLSYGVFDAAYQFKRPESAAEGGKVYWDDTNLDATEEQLLEQMDFPLVSIAMSYDEGSGRDNSEWAPLIELMPLFGKLFSTVGPMDERDPESWKPKGPGEVLARGGTATRIDYEGHGLAKGVAHWIMFEAAAMGFRAIQIGLAHPAVQRMWMNPPPPFKAELIYSFNTATYEEEIDGVKSKPWAACGDTPFSKIWVTLR